MKIPATVQKLRGGYYTPEPIAHFLAEWAIENAFVHVLEPSCGDGSIIEAAAIVLAKQQVAKEKLSELLYGVEIDAIEAEKTYFRLSKYGITRENIIVSDFFNYCREQILLNNRFDVILGNPPFISITTRSRTCDPRRPRRAQRIGHADLLFGGFGRKSVP